MMAEIQVPYTLEIQGVIDVDEEEWTRETLEDHLGNANNVSIKIEKLDTYEPDYVELVYLDFEDPEDG
jgi:hypothetical protein